MQFMLDTNTVIDLMKAHPAVAERVRATHRYAGLRADLEHRGTPLDLLIAAYAQEVGLTLVSRDQVFRQVHGLAVQDWSA